MSRLPYSLALSGFAFAFALTAGLALGLAAAGAERPSVRSLVFVLTLIAQSLPTFLSGLILILVVSVGLGWLPSSGAATPGSILLPGIALGAYSFAIIARVVMTTLREELAKDYVRACRARGLSRTRILLAHALRNAAPTILSLVALEAGNLMAGTLVVETVFAWPGIGQLLLQSVQARDYQVAQAVVLVVAVVYIGANLLADLAQMLLHPPVRQA
jgi:peptide/nickel transport system permease protein